MSESKRFEDWEEVDCNDCSHYWDSSCDGVPKDKKRNCTSYLATRNIVIPLQIKALRNHIRWLYGVVIFEVFITVLCLIGISGG